jgi:hypothetical protein
MDPKTTALPLGYTPELSAPGVEPGTRGLKGQRSTIELRAQKFLITNFTHHEMDKLIY